MHRPDLLRVDEADILRLILSFLESSGFTSSADELQRESSVKSFIPEPGPRLRALVLQARWDEVIEMVNSLNPTQEVARIVFLEITKQRYAETVDQESGKTEISSDEDHFFLDHAGTSRTIANPDELHSQTEEVARYLLKSRVKCFGRIWNVLGYQDRMVSLLSAGLVHEACERYCRKRAGSSPTEEVVLEMGSMLDSSLPLGEYHLSSWLQSVPQMVLTKSFVHRPLQVEVIPVPVVSPYNRESTKVITKSENKSRNEEAVMDEVREEAVMDEVREKAVMDEVREEAVMDEVHEEAAMDEVREEADVNQDLDGAVADHILGERPKSILKRAVEVLKRLESKKISTKDIDFKTSDFFPGEVKQQLDSELITNPLNKNKLSNKSSNPLKSDSVRSPESQGVKFDLVKVPTRRKVRRDSKAAEFTLGTEKQRPVMKLVKNSPGKNETVGISINALKPLKEEAVCSSESQKIEFDSLNAPAEHEKRSVSPNDETGIHCRRNITSNEDMKTQEAFLWQNSGDIVGDPMKEKSCEEDSFFQRKRHILELLQAKDDLRKNLLQSLMPDLEVTDDK